MLLENKAIEEAALDANYLYEHTESNEDVLLLKARVEKAKANLKEAEKIYSEVIDFDPFSIEAYKERSEVRKSLGDIVGATEDEERANEMETEAPQSSEGIEQKIKKKMQQMDPYKVFHNF